MVYIDFSDVERKMVCIDYMAIMDQFVPKIISISGLVR
jgi:hypothetical protein